MGSGSPFSKSTRPGSSFNCPPIAGCELRAATIPISGMEAQSRIIWKGVFGYALTRLCYYYGSKNLWFHEIAIAIWGTEAQCRIIWKGYSGNFNHLCHCNNSLNDIILMVDIYWVVISIIYIMVRIVWMLQLVISDWLLFFFTMAGPQWQSWLFFSDWLPMIQGRKG